MSWIRFLNGGIDIKCKRCGNNNSNYFLAVNNHQICRKCIVFGKQEELTRVSFNENVDCEYILDFALSKEQIKTSEKVKELSLVSDVLVYAACGTGKTEIVMETIKFYLENSKKVIITIPRRQVVLEVAERMKNAFKNLTVVAVCEGHTKELFGDLIICTTHQLYRYTNYADLLIIDEPDAFPYKGNEMLKNFAVRACGGTKIYLTATPDEELLKLPQVRLFMRFHGYPLLVPDVIIRPKLLLLLKGYQLLREHKRTLIFVPSKKIAKLLGGLLKLDYITSDTVDKEKIIKRFNNYESKYLITTTILERGVTFIGVNILVLYADHVSFDLASLIQISGRVGRSATAPTGAGIFLCRRKSRKVEECNRCLLEMNA